MIACLLSPNTPIAPRLVGIELNPGPPSIRSLTKRLEQAALSGARVLVAPTKKNRKRKLEGRGGPFGNPSRSITYNAPVSRGTVRRRSSDTSSSGLRVPFSSGAIRVFLSNVSSGLFLSFQNQDNGILFNSNYNELDLHPITNGAFKNVGFGPVAFQDGIFGPGIRNVAAGFKYWKLSSLRGEFNSVLPTTETGLLSFCYSPDPFSVNTLNFTVVASRPGACDGPVYASGKTGMTFSCPNLVSKWLNVDYVIPPTDGTGHIAPAEQRNSFGGTILMGGLGLNAPAPGNTKLLGVIHLTGVMLFKDLSSDSTPGQVAPNSTAGLDNTEPEAPPPPPDPLLASSTYSNTCTAASSMDAFPIGTMVLGTASIAGPLTSSDWTGRVGTNTIHIPGSLVRNWIYHIRLDYPVHPSAGTSGSGVGLVAGTVLLSENHVYGPVIWFDDYYLACLEGTTLTFAGPTGLANATTSIFIERVAPITYP